MYKAACTILFLFFYICSHAQEKRFEYADSSLLMETQTLDDNNSDVDENSNDNSNSAGDILSDTTLYIYPINISPDSVVKWKNEKQFSYIRDIDNLLKKKQQEDISKYSTENEPSEDSWLQKLLSSQFLRVFFWIVAIAFVLIVLYKLFLSNAVFTRNTKSSEPAKTPEMPEPVTVSDYDKLIQQSCRLGDYRMAIRYLFLKNLAALADHEYLVLSTEKTNYQYVQEIEAGFKNEFASLVLIYEYTWYGNFKPAPETYTGVEKKYIEFYKKIIK